VVATVPADEAHSRAILVGQHAPTVDFLLVHPAVAVEWFADLRGAIGV
jgi:hypothetical protein